LRRERHWDRRLRGVGRTEIFQDPLSFQVRQITQVLTSGKVALPQTCRLAIQNVVAGNWQQARCEAGPLLPESRPSAFGLLRGKADADLGTRLTKSGDTHRSPAIAQRLWQSTVMLKLPE